MTNQIIQRYMDTEIEFEIANKSVRNVIHIFFNSFLSKYIQIFTVR